MNREHKYKAIRLDNGEWVYGFYTKIPSPNIMFINNDSVIDCAKIDPETVCEYTGVKKNNVDIYEGDFDKEGLVVAWCDHCHGFQFGQVDVPTKDICIPCHACDGNFFFDDAIGDFEVIGNIHDKAEMK